MTDLPPINCSGPIARRSNPRVVNSAYLSKGWRLTQQKRWGLLDAHPDYLAVAQQINQVEFYRQAASALNINVPGDPMRSSTLIDGVVWNGRNPVAYTDGFEVCASPQPIAYAA